MFASAALAHSVAHAASDHDQELERWVFSGALEVGLYGHSAKASARGTPLTGPPLPSPPPPAPTDGPATVIDPVFDRGDVTSALVGGTLEVMTPRLLDLPGRPRLFLDLNVSGVLTSESPIVRDGRPGEFGFPTIPNVTTIGDTLIEGTGTEVTAQTQSPQIHAGFGPAFTVDLGAERLRIKPSVVYSRTRLDVSAVTNRAVRLTPNNRDLTSYRLLEFKDDRSEVYHGLGPALEIEYDTDNRFGPFLLSLFIKGHGSYLFGDLSTNLQKANPDQPDEVVRWRYENDRWAYRASTGLRFRWVPETR